MPEWFGELSLGGIAVAGLIFVVYTYITKAGDKKKEADKPKTTCAAQLSPIIIENTKVTSQLLTMLQQQQNDFKETNDKTQEVLQNLVLTTHELIMLTREMLSRVKDIERK